MSPEKHSFRQSEGRGKKKNKRRPHQGFPSNREAPLIPSSQQRDAAHVRYVDRRFGAGTGNYMLEQVNAFRTRYQQTHGGRMPTEQDVWDFSQQVAREALRRKNNPHS